MGTIGRKPNDAPLTSADINDGIVTPDDLSTGHPIWTTNGNVLIGTTTNTSRGGPTTKQLTKLADGEAYVDIQASSTSANCGILFSDGSTGNYGAIQYIHSSDALQLYSAGIERMRIDSSGHAIIPAGVTLGTSAGVYNAANTLDDYEEGTWTPAVYGTTAAGTGTYTGQYGYYTKIGDLVHYNAFVIWTAHTGTGNLRISGLPFTEIGTGGYAAVTVRNDGTTVGTGYQLQGYVTVNDTTIILERAADTTGIAANLPMDTVGSIMVSGTYKSV